MLARTRTSRPPTGRAARSWTASRTPRSSRTSRSTSTRSASSAATPGASARSRRAGYAWSVSSLATSGQSATRRNAYNEVDYGVYYGYSLGIAEDWSLDTAVAKKWVTLPGYHPHAHSISEWNISQSVTPYYLLRRAYHGQQWCYWEVGLTRSWKFLDDFTFTATVFGELGDSRHFAAQYGENPNGDGRYSNGLMALNLRLRLDYALTKYVGLFVYVHQFDVVSSDARDALDASSAPEALKDLTMGGVGITVKF